MLKSQVVLKSFKSGNVIRGNSLARAIQVKTLELVKSGCDIHYIRVPGHRNVPGNEAADRSAKRAAARVQNDIENVASFADMKARVHKRTTEVWRTQWEHSTARDHLKHTQRDVKPTIWSQIRFNRHGSPLLTQLRTGDCLLSASLHRFDLNATPLCRCGAPETVFHFLFECVIYVNLRLAFQIISWVDSLNNFDNLKLTFAFARETERFKFFY